MTASKRKPKTKTEDPVEVTVPEKKNAKKEKQSNKETSRARLKETVDELKKIKGAKAISIGSKSRYSGADAPRFSTGSIALDYATAGGVPEGKITQIFGDPDSGKTSLAYAIIGSAQHKCRRCRQQITKKISNVELEDKDGNKVSIEKELPNWVAARFAEDQIYRETTDEIIASRGLKLYADIEDVCDCKGAPDPFIVALAPSERKYDNSWGKCFGVDGDDLTIINGETGDDVVDIIDGLLRQSVVDMVVLDSVAALCPKKEVEKSAFDDTPAVLARLMNKALRKWSSSLAGHGDANTPTLILINQTRMNIGIFYGNPMVRPGGRMQLFSGALDIQMSKGKFPAGRAKKKHLLKDRFGRAIAKWVKFKITKCVVGPPDAEGGYPIYVRSYKGRSKGSRDDEWATAELTEAIDMFQSGVELEGKVFQDITELVEAFYTDRGFFRLVRRKTLDHLIHESSDWMKFKAWSPLDKKAGHGDPEEDPDDSEPEDDDEPKVEDEVDFS